MPVTESVTFKNDTTGRKKYQAVKKAYEKEFRSSSARALNNTADGLTTLVVVVGVLGLMTLSGGAALPFLEMGSGGGSSNSGGIVSEYDAEHHLCE